MLLTSLLPARFRTTASRNDPPIPGYLNRHISPLLQSLSRRSCTHPIHIIVFVSLLASTSYIGLLEGSLFDSRVSAKDGPQGVDIITLLDGGRSLMVGEDTGWMWQSDSRSREGGHSAEHLAVITLVFPNSLSKNSPQTAPLVDAVPIPSNSSAQPLPSTSNPFSPISQDTTLAFSVAWSEASTFLSGLQEIPEHSPGNRDGDARTWIMKANRSRGNGSQYALRTWARNAWSEFVDLLKNAESLDIVIMVLGYLSMHLTFVSLFMSMRRMGSNFWLATTVLFSSVFAFLFGLIVTTKLGVPINMVLLSEGLPFLVVTIGFEKPIILTKAVLSASLHSRRQGARRITDADTKIVETNSSTIQSAVQAAVHEKGFAIVRDYAIEVAILIAGAASGVQGGLRQFCFLAAWILFFDCLLLFTFYTAILSVKLEINRIKRHVTLRRALEEDGVSHRVAENVAISNEWPRLEKGDGGTDQLGVGVFGKKVRDSSVPKFKILMMGGFMLINVVNLCTIPFRAGNKNAVPPIMSGISGVVTSPPIDPFKVADNGLEFIHNDSKQSQRTTMVTILPPIKYELFSNNSPSYLGDTGENDSLLEVDYTDQLFDVVGGRVIEGVLNSLEDPVLSKWIIVALTISIILNGYLFNAARWSVPNESVQTNGHVIEPPARPKAAPIEESQHGRTPPECEQMVRESRAAELSDGELLALAVRGKIPGHLLEKTLDNPELMTKLASLTRAVKIRRGLISRNPETSGTSTLLEGSKLPYENYNYENVFGACCENVIGFLPLPLGVAGPLMIDGQSFYLPMATTEGVLVASTNRGCKAINAGGGAVTILTGDGMTRGPCVGFRTLKRAGAAKIWLDSEEGQKVMKTAFNSTSQFARLQSMKTALAGTYLYIRFKTTTGDAMGMNMISKGVECALNVMMQKNGFEDMSIISVSGNFCTDKKPAAINWIDGRGKSVVAEAIIPGEVVRKQLKSDVSALVELNTAKNLIGSAMAGSIGGFNAHAANVLTAMFLATGQDPAQVVESSNCITVMKNYNGDLQISVSMPCIEVGTIGGGTVLEPQQAMLDLLGVRGAHPSKPGDNARQLARIIAASVLAGELSLCSALAAGHLVQAHMAHNRSTATTRSSTPVSAALQAGPNRSQVQEGLSMTIGR